MKLLIDTESDSSFSIDVDFLDTLLIIKQKIEKAQGIPVYKQTLFFKGKVLQDQFKIRFCHILGNSSLFLYISPDDNPNQNVNDDRVPQTEQSPSNPIHQDFPVMSNTDSMKGFLGIQDSPQGKSNQVLHQTGQSSASSNSFEETSYGGDVDFTMEQICKKNQHDRPVTVQRVMARRIDSGSSRPSYSLEGLLGPQDLVPVTAGSRRKMNQVVQTEISSPSDSVKEVLRILDSPVTKKIKTILRNLTVFVQPFQETRMIPVVVNANDKVEELRKELVKLQEKGELNLPHEGYYFIIRELTLTETESFMWNLVVDDDTIEIIRINQT
ncbi:PREDICTED: uncharacterized protein LOC104738486 [Camelina sativa]|uniref:Uncharacterized protein LOC104738486 n=1 Tax=Camelina sativa TaxID=90675 RepID=A0ABM0VIZ8_CAMSA|nr:PREDICTED: uncharacterized protein LOC104738486 [Camelina sativa]